MASATALRPNRQGSPTCWLDSPPLPRFPVLDRDLRVDVAVIGGGLTGITSAFLLTQAGLSVALLERARCGGVDTSATTAHLTSFTDVWPSELRRRFGSERALRVWNVGQAAIAQIEKTVRQLEIDCDFMRVPGFLYAAHDGGDEAVAAIREEARVATELGIPSAFCESAPVTGRPAVRFENQAKFHPYRYVRALLADILRAGNLVFEDTEGETADERNETLLLTARGFRIFPGYLVIATHNPWAGTTSVLGASLFQSKLALRTSYVVAGRLRRTGTLPEGCFWDTAQPYRYLRIDRERVLIGGEDHKTGQADDTADRPIRLKRVLAQIVPGIEITHRWSGQVIESNDGLPLIGKNAPRQFVATGFAGNGMTFGTAAAIMGRDTILGNANPWTDLFAVDRETILKAPLTYLDENKDYPYYLARRWLHSDLAKSIDHLRPGHGQLVELDGKPLAAYRPPDGETILLSAVCPHLGCLVRWNGLDTSWECPCHGSRFSPTGDVLAGPAEQPLAPVGPPRDPS